MTSGATRPLHPLRHQDCRILCFQVVWTVVRGFSTLSLALGPNRPSLSPFLPKSASLFFVGRRYYGIYRCFAADHPFQVIRVFDLQFEPIFIRPPISFPVKQTLSAPHCITDPLDTGSLPHESPLSFHSPRDSFFFPSLEVLQSCTFKPGIYKLDAFHGRLEALGSTQRSD